MRLRNIPGAREIIADSPLCIDNPEEYKGDWAFSLFNNTAPLHIEIGTGKGRFITDLASISSDINYLGLERYESVLYKALKKIPAEGHDNLRFICCDATNVEDFFAPEEVDRIYLNFSDPWPKERHAKRRLTSPLFLAHYKNILKNGGDIQFKTDNRPLFDYSVETLKECEFFELDYVTYDLHSDPILNEGNIMTEYEEKFSSIGNPICKLRAILKK